MRKVALLVALAGASVFFIQYHDADLFAPFDPKLEIELVDRVQLTFPGASAPKSKHRPYWAARLDEGEPDPSPYFIASRNLFAELLAGVSTDGLIVPCTIPPGGRAFDRIERMLISMQVALEIQRATDLSVVDPFLAGRAIGEGRRHIPLQDVDAVAREFGVKWYLICETRYFDDELRPPFFEVRWKRFALGGSSDEPVLLVEVEQKELPLDVERLPHVEIIDEIANVVAKLALVQSNDSTTADQATVVSTSESSGFEKYDVALPESPTTLLKISQGSAASRIWQLGFVGALFPETPEIGAERLFIQMLLAAHDLPARDPSKALAKARALFHLGRRPAAIAVLRNDTTAAATALLAALDGNLVALDAAVPEIAPGILRLLAEIDLMDLKFEYDAISDTARRRRIAQLVAPHPAWAPLIRQRLYGRDPWLQLEPGVLKDRLDKTFPVQGYMLEDLLTGGLVLGKPPMSAVELDVSIHRHIAKLIENEPRAWCCMTSLRSVDRWDLLDLFQAVGESELIKKVEFQTTSQGRPDRALELLDDIGATYDGHPDFARLRAEALVRNASAYHGVERTEQLQRASEAIRDAVLWSDGQSWASASALGLLGDHDIPRPFTGIHVYNALVLDYPIKPYWPPWSHGGSPRALRQTVTRRLRNSTWHYSSVEYYLRYYRENPLAFLESLGDRFAGNSRRTEVRVDYLLHLDKHQEALAVLRAAIDAASGQWEIYDRYARLQIDRGDYRKARDATLRYPGFSDPEDESAVKLSSYAHTVGSYFFWRGIDEYAREFYTMAVEYGSGSEADLASQQRIAILDRLYADAARVALQRANRYNSAYAYRDYMSLLFAMGFEQEAWAAFDVLASTLGRAQIWAAADLGKRVEGATDSEMTAWLTQPEIRNGRVGEKSAAVLQTIRHFVMDRDFPEDLEAFIKELVGTHNTRVTHDGKLVIRPADRATPNDEILGPSHYNGNRQRLQTGLRSTTLGYDPVPAPGEVRTDVPSEYVLFAEGYGAWRRGEKEAAEDAFETLARYYEVAHPRAIWMLPYFAAGLASTDSASKLAAYLDAFSTSQRKFDWHLAMAFVEAHQDDGDSALAHLDAALDIRPHTEDRPIFTAYQWAQSCENIWKITADIRMKQRLLAWSQKVQRIMPFKAWPYAVEAQLVEDDETRMSALGMALLLDPQSTRLRDFSESDKERARRHIETRNPFRRAASIRDADEV